MNVQMDGDAVELRLRSDNDHDRRFIRAIVCAALDGGKIIVKAKDDPEAIMLTWAAGGEKVLPEPPRKWTWLQRLTSPVWLKAFCQALFRGRQLQ